MGRYRVNVECSQKLPQTKSEYFTHCSYEVQAISKGVAKAMVEDKARAEHGGCTCKAYSVVMRCQGQNTSKGKALDALEDAYLSTVAQLMRKDLSKAEQEEAAKEFGETMQGRLLAMVRGKGKRYMVSSEKEMSFMTELMRRQGEVQP